MLVVAHSILLALLEVCKWARRDVSDGSQRFLLVDV